MVPDHWLKYQATALVFLQFGVIYLVQDLSWSLTLLLSYTVAGLLNHMVMLALHEITHGAAFGYSKPKLTKIFSIFVNLPIGVPCAISFKKYHLDHHKFQGDVNIDVDLPTEIEARMFNSRFTKLIWVIFQGIFYAFRPLIVRPQPLQPYEVINMIVQVAFDVLVYVYLGPKPLVYMIVGAFLGMGLHPIGAHHIAEHYMFKNGFETYSYYGPLNYLMFNIGYHNEHHDFPNIPGSLLPKVREIAPEFYENLPSHNSLIKVLYDFINDPAVGLYSRMRRDTSVKHVVNGEANRQPHEKTRG